MVESCVSSFKYTGKTHAMRFDELIHSDIGFKLFPRSQSPIVYKKTTSGLCSSNVRPSTSFTSQGRGSKVPNYLYSKSFYKGISIKNNIDEAHSDIISINEKMKLIENQYNHHLSKLEQALTPKKRLEIHKTLQKNNEDYQNLKKTRLNVIKQQRIMKNQYPEGFEIHYWQECNKLKVSEKVSNNRKQERLKSNL